MAAPLKQWNFGRISQILRLLRSNINENAVVNSQILCRSNLVTHSNGSSDYGLIRSETKPVLCRRFSCVSKTTTRSSKSSCSLTHVMSKVPLSVPSHATRSLLVQTTDVQQTLLRNISTSSVCNKPSDGYDQGQRGSPDKPPMKLMDFKVQLLPNPLKSLKNMIMSILITGFIDHDFSQSKFQEGAEQAILHVSKLISDGKFDELKGLVDSKAVAEIRNHYSRLNAQQRQSIALKKEEMTFVFIYEIGMMFNKNKDDGYLEIEVTMVIHNLPAGLDTQVVTPALIGANLTCCNYRFIRAYEKKTPLTDWIINRLNHSNSNDQFYSRYD